MKLYRLFYHQDDSGSGYVYEWFTTKREATKREKAVIEEEGQGNVYGIKIADVPTKKVELVKFLNVWACNG